MFIRSLFRPTVLGPLALRNHLVMAPMTRSRAGEANTPNALMAEYYAAARQRRAHRHRGHLSLAERLRATRASLVSGRRRRWRAGGWSPTPCTAGAAASSCSSCTPAAWATRSTCRPAAEVLAPSAVAAPGEMFTDAEGMQPHPVPAP